MSRCIWCDSHLDDSDQLQVAYSTCERCLVPLPTD